MSYAFVKYSLLVLISFILRFFNSFLLLLFLVFFSFFQVMFEGEHSGISPHGDISIDDVSFTPECRPAPHGTVLYLLVLDIKWSSLEKSTQLFSYGFIATHWC